MKSSIFHFPFSILRFWLFGLLIAGGLCWFFPPFHIVPLRQSQQKQQQDVFDAAAFAGEFWQKKLLPATGRGVDIAELAATLARDPATARQRLGHSPGLSATSYFFVKGSGLITVVDKESIRIRLDGPMALPSVELFTGLLFGNTVRDATGFLNVSDFPNSQDFNSVSTELNHIVEAQVVPGLRQRAAVGKAIRFAGCLELEEGPVPKSLQLIPVKVDWP